MGCLDGGVHSKQVRLLGDGRDSRVRFLQAFGLLLDLVYLCGNVILLLCAAYGLIRKVLE